MRCSMLGMCTSRRASLAPLYARLHSCRVRLQYISLWYGDFFQNCRLSFPHAIRASISRSYMSCASKIASLGSCARFMSEQSSRDKSSLANSNTSSEGMINRSAIRVARDIKCTSHIKLSNSLLLSEGIMRQSPLKHLVCLRLLYTGIADFIRS